MRKVDISILKHIPAYTNKCIFCEKNIYGEYYDLNIEYQDNTIHSGHYRNICNLCYCQLKKHFTGVD